MTVLKACGTNIYKGRGEHFYNTRYNFFRFNSTQQCNIKTNISPDQKGHNYLTNITSNFKNGVELHNTLFPVAEKLNLVEVELSSTEESEAAAYGVVVEAAELHSAPAMSLVAAAMAAFTAEAAEVPEPITAVALQLRALAEPV